MEPIKEAAKADAKKAFDFMKAEGKIPYSVFEALFCAGFASGVRWSRGSDSNPIIDEKMKEHKNEKEV